MPGVAKLTEAAALGLGSSLRNLRKEKGLSSSSDFLELVLSLLSAILSLRAAVFWL